MILAGNDTTSTTLTWALFELARNPQFQADLRREIDDKNTWEPTFKDLEAMPLLNATIMVLIHLRYRLPHSNGPIQETLRTQPSLGTVYRQAAVDEVLPLSTPITLNDGRRVSELAVQKGTKMLVSIESYNKHRDLWGADANEFNPRRWLDAEGKLGMNGYSDT